MCAAITASTVVEFERNREDACAASTKEFPSAMRKSRSSASPRSVDMDREACFPVSASRHGTAQVTRAVLALPPSDARHAAQSRSRVNENGPRVNTGAVFHALTRANNVEMGGIEPPSGAASSGLLRAQCAVDFLSPGPCSTRLDQQAQSRKCSPAVRDVRLKQWPSS